MKICISFRDPPSANLRSGNLRSEGRYENQAFEAMLDNPEVTDVYSLGYRWPGKHSKYRGLLRKSDANGCILLAQDWNNNLFQYDWKGAVVNIFSGPWLEQLEEVADAYNKLKGNLVFTMGFPIMFRNEMNLTPQGEAIWAGDAPEPERVSHLEKFLPRSNIKLLPVPGAPYIQTSSNFDKNKLIWGQRIIFMSQMTESVSLQWAMRKLEKNPALELVVLTGWKAEEVKDYIYGQVVLRSDIVEAFWELPAFAPHKAVSDRVKVILEVDWNEALALYSEAKLLIVHGKLFGGPPIEAGLHGVPFVGTAKTGALGDCEHYLHEPDPTDACLLLEVLMEDREFYDAIGNSYREYVNTHYTFDAFNRNFNEIVKSFA